MDQKRSLSWFSACDIPGDNRYSLLCDPNWSRGLSSPPAAYLRSIYSHPYHHCSTDRHPHLDPYVKVHQMAHFDHHWRVFSDFFQCPQCSVFLLRRPYLIIPALCHDLSNGVNHGIHVHLRHNRWFISMALHFLYDVSKQNPCLPIC